MMNTVLDIQHISKQYGDGNNVVHALHNISFTISQGEFTGIMGPSGCGKSTLLNVIATIDKVTGGCVLLGRQNIDELSENAIAEFRRDNLGFVFQDYNLLNTLTLRENIALALTIQNKPKNQIDSIITPIAEKLGIESVLDKFPYEVSGGQCQRCACARAVAVKPKLILADEPTGALDSVSAKNLMETFVSINVEMGATVLMVTHDAFSACYCRRILFLRDGCIVKELHKGDLDNQAFLQKILTDLGAISEGVGHVC
jgi:putative ABC transport system ATP-binding protein